MSDIVLQLTCGFFLHCQEDECCTAPRSISRGSDGSHTSRIVAITTKQRLSYVRRFFATSAVRHRRSGILCKTKQPQQLHSTSVISSLLHNLCLLAWAKWSWSRRAVILIRNILLSGQICSWEQGRCVLLQTTDIRCDQMLVRAGRVNFVSGPRPSNSDVNSGVNFT